MPSHTPWKMIRDFLSIVRSDKLTALSCPLSNISACAGGAAPADAKRAHCPSRYTHSLSHTHTLSLSHTHSLYLTQANSRSHTHTRSLFQTHTLSLSLSLTLSHSHALSHTRSLTQAHTLSLYLSLPLSIRRYLALYCHQSLLKSDHPSMYYRGTSLIRKCPPPRITIGPLK